MKKILYFIIIIFFTFMLLIILKKISDKNNDNYKKNINEIIPEEEISEEQERKTIITLYFNNLENNKLDKEYRKIDVKKLAENPYREIINMLIEGPQNEKLEELIPEETKINNVMIDGDTVIIDFSNEFIENCKEGEEKQILESLAKTLSELNEVNYVKILINGEENKKFIN